MRHRPIALGVQGLADAFMELRLPFDSQEARELNIQIFETIYHAAVEASLNWLKKKVPTKPIQVLQPLKVYYNLICGTENQLNYGIGIH